VLQVVGQPHQVDQFLISTDLNAVALWTQPGDFKLIELLLFNQHVVDSSGWVAGLAVSGVNHFQPDIGEPLVNKPQLFGGGSGEVDIAVFYVRSAVIDHDYDGCAVGQIGDADARSKGKRLMRCLKPVVVILLPAGG